MPRYALVDEQDIVTNVIAWDGVTPYVPAAGLTVVLERVGTAEIGLHHLGDGSFEVRPVVADPPEAVETLVDAAPRPTVQDIDNALAVIATEPALTQEAKDAITAIARAATRGIAPDA